MQNEEDMKTKRRRTKKIRGKLTKFKILYCNINHLKSKSDTLEKTIREEIQ